MIEMKKSILGMITWTLKIEQLREFNQTFCANNKIYRKIKW